MKVLVLSKREFDKMMDYTFVNDDNVEEKDIMIISVCSPPDDNRHSFKSQKNRELWFKREHPNVKIMYFGDYGEHHLDKVEYLFTNEQAKELYEFIKINKDKSRAIIHCGAGISRSGAIGVFIHSLYGNNSPEMTYEEFKRIFEGYSGRQG